MGFSSYLLIGKAATSDFLYVITCDEY